MANTVWKGQLTFGLVSFAVRLVRAARKDRIPLRYIREGKSADPDEDEERAVETVSRGPVISQLHEHEGEEPGAMEREPVVEPVRQAYTTDQQDEPLAASQLQRGYEVTPGRFAVVHTAELRRLREPTSPAMEIVRSVRMDEIDPVFLETSYYILPGNGGEHSYSLFYRALKESGYAVLAEVAMHGRRHVIVIRSGARGLIGHTMFYVNEVRASEEHATETADIPAKELDLAKRLVEAISAPFQPEEFTDRYREQLQSLIASKETVASRVDKPALPAVSGKAIDLMDALRKSLEQVKREKSGHRKPAVGETRSRQRKRQA